MASISVIDYIKKWGPWIAVFTGAYGVFIFSFFSEFSPIARQTVGLEMLRYATAEVLLRATASAFLARVAVVVFLEPTFTVIRMMTMQIPLRALNYAPARWRKYGLRALLKCRRLADRIYASIVRSPLEISLFLTCLIFFYWTTGSLLDTAGGFLFIFCVFVPPYIIEKQKIGSLALRLHPSARLGDISSFKHLALSTTVLTAAYILGLIEAKMLVADAASASISGEPISVVFISDSQLLGFIAGKDGSVWKIMPVREIDITFSE